MLLESVTTDVTNDIVCRLFLEVGIVHKIMVQERGARGIEFDSRDHSQIDIPRETVALEENTRGYCFYERNHS